MKFLWCLFFGHDPLFRDLREGLTVLVCPYCHTEHPFDATFQKAVIRGPQHQQSEARGVPKIKATSKKIKSISAARASQRS
jgi:hypothetical protein